MENAKKEVKKTRTPQKKGGGKKGSGRKPQGGGYKPPYRATGHKSTKPARQAEEIADTGAAMSRENPVSLYLKYEQFAHDAATIPFAQPLGAKYDVPIHLTPGVTLVNNGAYADAGVMRIVFSPCIGVSSQLDTPINRASINNFARIRQTQKAFGDYDHQDLTFMMLAIDSCIMYHALGRRIYGLLTDMTPVNRYYPRALVAASGVSFTSSQQQIQDFRAFLNEFALQVEQYALPKDILLFDRHQWMCEGIYVDSNSRKAQTYMFVPRGFWQYDSTQTTGSQLNFIDYIQPGSATTNYTIEQFMTIGQNLIKAMTNDADFALMSGDLYAYYGSEQTYKLPYIEEKYTILPKFDKTVLSQIENATLVGDWASTYTPVISQNPQVNGGSIMFEPIVDTTVVSITTQARLNMHVDSPTPDEVIEATRLTTVVTPAPSGHISYVTECASEIAHYADIFQMNPSTGNPRSHRIASMWQVFSASRTIAEWTNLIGNACFMCSFDWAPRLEYIALSIDSQGNPSSLEYAGSTWDVDNMTNIRNEYLETIHTACLYSLFNMTTK